MTQKTFTNLFLICLFFSLLFSPALYSQVTIGIDAAPESGALLQLKDNSNKIRTASKGLGLPRVELKDLNKLIMGNYEVLDSQDGGGQYAKHTGLVVYNVSGGSIPQCAAPIPNGIYVWDGTVWNALSVDKSGFPTLNLSLANNIDFPSGRDLRVFPTTPVTFSVNWTPSSENLVYTNTSHATWGGISFNRSDTILVTGNLTNSPTVFSFLPKAMTAAEVAANPFLTKENTLKFFKKGNLCGSDMTEIRILNQTNKALVFPSTLITHRGSDGSTAAGTTPLTTNADWKLISKEPSNVTTISNIVINNSTSVNTFPTATQTGYEQNNNAGKLVTLTYNVTMDLNKPRFNYLTFADATTPKRFADVRLAILQCPSGQQPSIEGWALIGGFTQAEIDAVKATGNDSRILTNGMQMHRQANSIRGVNQIFLSSNFGANPGDSDERWMIHNLDAIAYDGTTYTGGDPIALSQGKLTGPNGNFSYVRAFWCYPGDRTTPTFYNQNQRLGLLYNWDAATAGKGGSDGKGNVDNTTSGGTEANNEVQFPEGSGVAQQKRRQGICPKGWHLPSAREWFKLEDVTIGENSIVFSNQINAIPYMTGNGGLVWKEPCEPSSDVTTQGTSNGISPVTRPGLDLLLAGYTIGYDVRYGEFAFLWSSSSVDDLTSWNRGVAAKHQFAYFNSNIRDIQGSVRCKKD